MLPSFNWKDELEASILKRKVSFIEREINADQLYADNASVLLHVCLQIAEIGQ